MKTALMDRDIEKSLAYFIEPTRERYRTVLTGLSAEQVSSIFLRIINIQTDSVTERTAECGAMREETDGIYSYPVTFVKDEDGKWLIMGF